MKKTRLFAAALAACMVASALFGCVDSEQQSVTVETDYDAQAAVDKYAEYLGELSEEDKLTVTRARKLQKFLSQPFAVAENFTGLKGVYVPLAETVKGFAAIVDGQCDDLPEWAFFNVGTLADARKKYADKQAEEKGGAN